MNYMKMRYKYVSILSLQMTKHYMVVRYFANEIHLIKRVYSYKLRQHVNM